MQRIGTALFTLMFALAVVSMSFAGGQGEAATTEQPITLTVWSPSNVEAFPAGMDENENPIIEFLEEESGYDLNWMIGPQENATAKVSLMLASGDTPDLMSPVGKAMYGELVNQRLLLALDDLLENEGSFFQTSDAVPNELWLAARYQGALYGIPQEGSVQANGGPLVRQDWLDELGLEQPTTVDDFYQVLTAFKNQYPDSIPMTGDAYSVRGGISPFAGAFNSAATYMELDGEVVDTRVTDDRREFLAFLAQLVQEGLLDQEYVINKGKNINEKVVSGSVGLFSSAPWGLRDLLPAFEEKNPGGEYSIIAPAVDENGLAGVLERRPVRGFAVIPADAEYPSDAMKFLADYASSDDIQDFVSYGIEGEHFTVNEEGLKQVLPAGEERKFNIYYVIWNTPAAHLVRAKLKGFWPTYEPFFKYSLYKEITTYAPPLPEVEEVKTPIADLTEEMFDKIIVGALPISAFDDYVDQWEQLGGPDALEAVRAWYASTQ
jgi:putative aldouronate transport system substrate-binding protein